MIIVEITVWTRPWREGRTRAGCSRPGTSSSNEIPTLVELRAERILIMNFSSLPSLILFFEYRALSLHWLFRLLMFPERNQPGHRTDREHSFVIDAVVCRRTDPFHLQF